MATSIEDIAEASRTYGPEKTTVNGDLTQQFDPITMARLAAIQGNNKFVQNIGTLNFAIAVPTSPCTRPCQ